MNLPTKNQAGLALALAASTLLCTGPAAFAALDITNGNFETGAPGDTSITGWTVINERIDLGVDEIAGCGTVDTSSYDILAGDYATGPEMDARNDSYLTEDNIDEILFATTIEDGTLLADPFTSTGQYLRLYSNMDASDDGYVVHGPAVYSDTFTAKTIDDLTLRWAATGEEDDYHVFGYLLNTDSCEQIEVIDSTGGVNSWEDVTVAIPENGTYRFVFVSGTYDLTWGSAAGAILLLDDIVLTVNEERSGGGSTGPKSLADTGFDAGTTGLVALLMTAIGAGIAFMRRLALSGNRRSK